MAKGQARIFLHSKKRFLIEALNECKTLHEIAAALALDGGKVSISSLYRYLVSDLPEDYAGYLQFTGRGLLKTRRAKGYPEISQKSTKNEAAKRERITNPGDMNKFLKEKR